jgi:hypothetical protein
VAFEVAVGGGADAPAKDNEGIYAMIKKHLFS